MLEFHLVYEWSTEHDIEVLKFIYLKCPNLDSQTYLTVIIFYLKSYDY